MGLPTNALLIGGGLAVILLSRPKPIPGAPAPETILRGTLIGPGGAADMLKSWMGVPTPTTATVAKAAPIVTAGAAAAAPLAEPPGFMLSDKAMAKLSLAAVKEVTKWFLTPPSPTWTPLAPDVQVAWDAYRASEWGDYSQWVGDQTPPVELADLGAEGEAVAAVDEIVQAPGGVTATSEGTVQAAASGASEATTVEGVSGFSMPTLATSLKILGTAGALIDIGFTIAGTMPDVQKAVNVALDAAIIVALWIPVYGWIIALVLSVVKLLVNMFGFSSGGLTHEQREALEIQRFQEHGAHPFIIGLANQIAPREIIRYLIGWGSGYGGGVHEYAIMTYLSVDYPLNTSMVYLGHHGGATAPGNTPNLFYVNNLATYPGHTRYRGMDPYQMTLDDMAWALVRYGATDFNVTIQLGVTQSVKDLMNAQLDEIITRRIDLWGPLASKGFSLDDMDALAAEWRKEKRLTAIAAFFGYPDWHELVGWQMQDLWTRYLVTTRHGSLQDFARKLGAPSWAALRDAIMGYDGRASFGAAYDYAMQLRRRLTLLETMR